MSKEIKVANIDKVSAAIVAKAIVKDSRPVINNLKRLEITDDNSYSRAIDKMRELKEWEKIAIAKEKSITGLLDKLYEEVQGLFSPFRDTVKALIAQKKEEMLLYAQSKKEAQKKLDRKLEQGKVSAKTYIAGTNQNNISSGLRKIWTPVPKDVSKTPREYLVPDLVKIREALKEGKKVAGWSWEQVDNISL